jgi:Predicted acetyltransferase
MDSLFFTDEGQEADAKHLVERIDSFNRMTAPTAQEPASEAVQLFLKDRDGRIYGGATGILYRYALFIHVLWISDELRGQGYGSKLLKELEEKVRAKGCRLIHLDTWDFQAPEFYKKQGFELFGTLEGFPEGFKRHYLRKIIG